MKACDQCNCSKKKICKVYDMIQKFKGEIDIEVNTCVYHGAMFIPVKQEGQTMPIPKVRDRKEINENSAKIHALQNQKDKDAPNTTNKAKMLGMQFTVDGEVET